MALMKKRYAMLKNTYTTPILMLFDWKYQKHTQLSQYRRVVMTYFVIKTCNVILALAYFPILTNFLSICKQLFVDKMNHLSIRMKLTHCNQITIFTLNTNKLFTQYTKSIIYEQKTKYVVW
eukprot:555666_1